MVLVSETLLKLQMPLIIFLGIGVSLARNITQSTDFLPYVSGVHSPSNLIYTMPTLIEIKNVIANIKEVETGHDNVPLFIFKDNIDLVGDMLRHLFTFSVASGVVPYNMMIAKVKCIYKSRDPKDASNYRPISVLPVLSKILERLTHTQLVNHLVQYNLLSGSQYGFRAMSSTELALQDISTSI